MLNETLEILKWWLSRLTFTIIVNLTVFGSYHAYQWYLTSVPRNFDVSRFTNEELNQASKDIFEEQKSRNAK